IAPGIEHSGGVPVLGPRARATLEEDFIRDNPRSTISKLLDSAEDGMYVVMAIVNDLVEGQDWWYPACRCHRSVTADSGAYFCKGCQKHVFHMVPRFKVKLHVRDATGDTIFVVFDTD
ncbi:replication factor A protein, partial [Trifolium medium]|nr:replication factor A protein [Trifolium medium]